MSASTVQKAHGIHAAVVVCGVNAVVEGDKAATDGRKYIINVPPRRVNHKWAETTVKVLLRNEVYIGNMVQGKCGSLSYKSKKLVSKPKEEWIRVEGTHEPIISREVWDTVVSIDQRKVRKPDTENGNRSISLKRTILAKRRSRS